MIDVEMVEFALAGTKCAPPTTARLVNKRLSS